MSGEQTSPHWGMLKGFLVQGLDDCLERLGDPTEPTHKHPITGSLIGNQLWAHRAAIVQIEGQEYDELISANPDNKLRYIDDDNELVIVGSSLELSQRLAESGHGGKAGGYRFKISPHEPKLPPCIGDYTSMHIFSINSNAREAWCDIEKLTQYRFASSLGAVFCNPLNDKGLALVKSLDDLLITGKGGYDSCQWVSGGSDQQGYRRTLETGDLHEPGLPDRIFVDGLGMISVNSAKSGPVALVKQESIVPAIAGLKDRLASLDRSIKRSRKHYKKLQASISGAGMASMLGSCAAMPPKTLDPVRWTEHPVEVLEGFVIFKERNLRMSKEACRDRENLLTSHGTSKPTDSRPALASIDSTVSTALLLQKEDAENMTPPDSAISGASEAQFEVPQPPTTIGLLSARASVGKSRMIDALLKGSSNLEKNELTAASKETMDDLRKRLAGIATPTPAENLAGLLLSFKDKNPLPKTDTVDASSAKMKLSNLVNKTETEPLVKNGDGILNGLPRADHLTPEGVRQAQEVGQKLRRQYFGAFKGKSVIRPSVSPDAERWASYGAGQDSNPPKASAMANGVLSTNNVEEQSNLFDIKEVSEPISDGIKLASVRVDNSKNLPTETPPAFGPPGSHPSKGLYRSENTPQQLPKQFFDPQEGLSALTSAACPENYTASATSEYNTKSDADQYSRLERTSLHPVSYGIDSSRRATAEDQYPAGREQGNSQDKITSTAIDYNSCWPRRGIYSGYNKIANVREDNSHKTYYAPTTWSRPSHQSNPLWQGAKASHFSGGSWAGGCSSPAEGASSSLLGAAESQDRKTMNVREVSPMRKRSLSMECIASSSTDGSVFLDDQTTKAHENKAREGRSGTLFGKLCELFPERTLKESSTISQTGKNPFPSRASSASNGRCEPSEEAGLQSRATGVHYDAELLRPAETRNTPSDTSLESTLRSLTMIAGEMNDPPSILAVNELERQLEILRGNVEELKKQALADMSESERYAHWKRSMGLATEAEPKQEASINNDANFVTKEMLATHGEFAKEPEPAEPTAASPPEQSTEVDPFENVEQLSSYVPDRTTSIASFRPVSSFLAVGAHPGSSSAYATPSTNLPEANSSSRTFQASSSSHRNTTQYFTESGNPSNSDQTTSFSHHHPSTTSNTWAHDDPTSVDKIPKCVDTLVDLGFEHRCQGGRNRLVVYAQLAGGDLNEAIEIISEEQKSYRQMNVG